MSDYTPDLFADDVTVPDIPPRSALYHCPILDEGTPRQESLLNYIHRLARVHHLRVMDLLVHIVLPNTQITVQHGRFRFAGEYARTTNGYGKYATELSSALAGLTGVADLKSATFLHWQDVFDGKGAGLLHPTRTWCPDCLAEAEERGEPHNFPLLWTCQAVTHCRTHLCELQTKCLRCEATQKPICDSSHYGRCVDCGASLAWRSSLFQSGRLSLRQEFVVKAVGEMIAAGPRAAMIARTENLVRGIRRVAEATHQGSVHRLARAIKITPTTLENWARGDKKPRFDAFLELSFRLGLQPLDLLGPNAVQCTPRLRPGSLPLQRPSFKIPPEKLREVETEILRNLAIDEAPITLIDLATKYGTSVGHLRYKLPEACRALTERFQMIRSLVSEMKRDDRMRRAAGVARQLFEQQVHLPRLRIQTSLSAEGLSIKCPETRQAAYDEIERLTAEEAKRFRRLAPHGT